MTQIAERDLESRQLASGTTYYIDPVNGVDSPNTTGGLTTPFKTISYAGGFAGPGDTVNLRGTGHYNNPAILSRSCVFDKSWAGTASNVVTVQSYTGETAIFDPGYPEFISNPNTAWVPCTDTGAHPDEYISVNTYTMVSNHGAFGSFLYANGQAGDRLLTYARLEDLRATNESFVRVPVSDPRAGQPIWGDTGYKWLWTYRGPGLWWDPTTQKIHARFSATHFNQPGVTDYSGSTDPRTLSLSVSLYGHYAVNVMSDYITFKNIVVQNGGNKSVQLSGSGSDYAEHVTFDHCTFNMSRNGFNFTLTRHARLLHCVFSGNLPSYVCRSDVKDSFDFVNAQGQQESAGCCRMTAACLLTSGGANDEDMEIAYCEFRNGHDGAHIFAYRPRVHHNLFENLNDEAVMFYGAKPAEDVQIYNNVFRKVLMAFSSSEGSWTSTGARYLYRNIIDQRVPSLGYRQLSPDPVLLWRYGQDFKFNLPVPEFYCYQNTFVMPDFGTNECSNVWSNISATAQWTRRYMNNIYMVIQTDKPLYFIPPPAYPDLSDGNLWCRRKTNVTAPLFNSYATGVTYATWTDLRNSSLWQSYFTANGVGWETHPADPPSPIAYPQFAGVADYFPTDGGSYLNTDYRLKSTSPARGGGADLTSIGWPDSAAADSTPDIGALPYGAAAVAVGVDGRYVFPDSTLPIAEADDYSIISNTNQTGFETVSFDGTGSSAPNGSISSYNWVYNGQTISTSATFSKDLPIGTHQVYLTITDNSSHTAKDMREVTVTDPTNNDNIVRNPGFESGDTDWIVGSGCAVVSSPTHYGGGALKLTGGATYVSTEQSMPIFSGSAITVSCWIKTDTISGGQTKLQLNWLDSDGGVVGSTYSLGQISGTTAWTYYSTAQTAPSTAVTARLKILLDGGTTGGLAYFDDIRLLITDNKVKNGAMERPLDSSDTAGWVRSRGTPTMLTDSSLSHSGPGSLQMVGIADYHMVEQFIPVNPGQVYTIQGWIKTVNMGTKKAWVELRFCNASGSQVTYPWNAYVNGTSAYTKVSPAGGTLTPPTGMGITQMKLTLKIDSGAAGGTAYFDDFYVK